MTAPGWYPDPNTGQQRYFDGVHWGPPAPPVGTPPAEPRFTVHYGFAIIAGLSLMITVFPAIPLFLSASDPNTHGFGLGMGVMWLVWGGIWTVVWAAFAVQHTLRGRRR